jgi:hypothetical protein
VAEVVKPEVLEPGRRHGGLPVPARKVYQLRVSNTRPSPGVSGVLRARMASAGPFKGTSPAPA